MDEDTDEERLPDVFKARRAWLKIHPEERGSDDEDEEEEVEEDFDLKEEEVEEIHKKMDEIMVDEGMIPKIATKPCRPSQEEEVDRHNAIHFTVQKLVRYMRSRKGTGSST